MLKTLRLSKGLTQADVSRLTGINIITYRAYEQGKRRISSYETVTSLATVLDVPPDTIASASTKKKEAKKK